jgi:hypothetical protein
MLLNAQNNTEAIGYRMLHKLAHHLVPNAGTLVMMALLLFAYHAWAAPSAAPQVAPASQVNTGLLSYQGYLTDAGGAPLTGDVDITFRLYDAPSGGAALWTETHTGQNAVPVEDGLFNVMLGSLTPISSTVWSSGASYLGVQVGNDGEMSPREKLGTVPHAMQASIAQTVPDRSIGSRQMAPSWYESYNESVLSTTSTDPVPTETLLNFICETDCTALILHRGLIAHSDQDGRVDVRIKVNEETVARELGVANAAYTNGHPWEPVSSFSFVNLPAGSHTVEVEFYCHGGTPGTCYYSGWHSDWEHLNVLILSQQ